MSFKTIRLSKKRKYRKFFITKFFINFKINIIPYVNTDPRIECTGASASPICNTLLKIFILVIA